MVKRYDSWSAFIACAKQYSHVAHVKDTGIGMDVFAHGDDTDSWFGGLTSYKAAITRAETGDESFVSDAEKLIDKLTPPDGGEAITQWLPSPCGAYPVIPDVLAGFPDSMRAIRPTGELSPINVYVSLACSGSISAEEMKKRGAAILALVLYMQRVRPIKLWLVSEQDGKTDNGDFLQVIPVDSQPLSIAHASYGICHVGFFRRLCMGIGNQEVDYGGRWPETWYKDYGRTKYLTYLRTVLDMSHMDIHVESVVSSSGILTNPVKWVNEQVTRFNEGTQ